MRKPIKLTENMLRGMVRKAISEALMRIDEASKHDYRGELRKVIYNYLNENRRNKELETTDASVTVVEKIFYGDFLHGYSSYKDPIKRIVPIFVRLALEHGFLKDDFFKNERVIKGLRSILTYIREGYDKLGNNFSLGKREVYIKKLNKYKTVDYKIGDIPDDITYEQLKELCSNAFNSNGEFGNGKLKIEDIDYSNSKGYEVRKNITFEEANKIGEKSGYNGDGRLCYTTSEGQWNNYTNSGANTVYVLLKDGYEDINPEEYVNDEERPYDDYGLSMIFLFVDPNGNLVWSNTRWNHKFQDLCPEGKRTDKNFTKEDIVEITGLSFDDHFIPHENKDEECLNRVETAVKNGEKTADYDVFDLDGSGSYSLISVAVLNKVNIFDNKNKRFLYSKWFEFISHGYYCKKLYCNVKYGDRQNVIMPDGSLMFDGSLNEWPVGAYWVGLRVWLFKTDDNKWNFIDYNGNILYEPKNQDEWFNSTALIDSDAIHYILINKWEQFYIFTKDDEIIDLESGINYLMHDKKYNLKQLFEDNLKRIDDNGLYSLQIGIREILVREDGTLPTRQNFLKIHKFQHGFAMVKEWNENWNYIDKSGNIIYEPGNKENWFDIVYDFDGSFAIVGKNGRRSLLDTNGKILSKPDNTELWFDFIYNDNNTRLYMIEGNGQYKFINKDTGQWVSPNLWYTSVVTLSNGLIRLSGNRRYTLMDKEGNILWEPNNPERWFDMLADPDTDGLMHAILNGTYYYIDNKLNFYDIDTKQPIQSPTGNLTTNESMLRLKNKIRRYVNEAINENLSRQEVNEGNFKNALTAGLIGAASIFGGNKAQAQNINRYDDGNRTEQTINGRNFESPSDVEAQNLAQLVDVKTAKPTAQGMQLYNTILQNKDLSKYAKPEQIASFDKYLEKNITSLSKQNPYTVMSAPTTDVEIGLCLQKIVRNLYKIGDNFYIHKFHYNETGNDFYVIIKPELYQKIVNIR